MNASFAIAGLQGPHCAARITRALAPFAERVQVTLDPPCVVLRGLHSDATLDVMQIAVAGAGKYTLTAGASGEGASAADRTVAPSRAWWTLLGFVLAITALLHVQAPGRPLADWIADLVAAWLLATCFFKLLDVNGFARVFARHDLLARRSVAYARAYPFIELALGLALLSRWQTTATLAAILLLMLLCAAGILAALRTRQLYDSASLGTVFKLPLSKLTLTEPLGVASLVALLLAWR